jgi:hypothetical protein
MANQQCPAARAQRAIEFDQRLADEFDTPVAPRRQRIENLAIEHKTTVNPSPTPQRFAERGVIEIAQIAAKPHQNRIQIYCLCISQPRRLK